MYGKEPRRNELIFLISWHVFLVKLCDEPTGAFLCYFVNFNSLRGFHPSADEWESDDDDDEEGEWMDVYHSSDEAEEVIC